MPATEIELDHGDKAFGRVIDSWDVQEHFGVAHEVCDPFKHAAWLEDESGKDDATQVGTGP
jgi:hypothetical protein